MFERTRYYANLIRLKYDLWKFSNASITNEISEYVYRIHEIARNTIPIAKRLGKKTKDLEGLTRLNADY